MYLMSVYNGRRSFYRKDPQSLRRAFYGLFKYSGRYLCTDPIRDNGMRLYEKNKIGCVTVSVMTLYVSQALLFVGNRVGVLSRFSWICNTNKYKKLIHMLPGNLLRLSEK
jgi:hypothetical protein